MGARASGAGWLMLRDTQAADRHRALATMKPPVRVKAEIAMMP